MEKRKWDVNSISVIQFSCEIKRKARIWEIWKLQLQDKWYLKGSYLIWLNWSSDVTREMHYWQVFQGFSLCIPNLGRNVEVSQVRRGSGWEESWVLGEWESVLPSGFGCCALGFAWGFWGSLMVVPQKNASVVESCSLSGSVWLMPHPDLWMAVRIHICCCFLRLFGSHSLYFCCGEVVPSGGKCLTDNNMVRSWTLCPAFAHTGLVSLTWPSTGVTSPM